MHAAVVERRPFILVPFARSEPGRHVADAHDGQFADLALSDEILDRIVVPGVAQIEVHRREERCAFGHLHGFPFVFDAVGDGFFGNDVFARRKSLFDLCFARVCQGEESYDLNRGIVENELLVGNDPCLRSEFMRQVAGFGANVADVGDLPLSAFAELLEIEAAHAAEADQTDSDGVHYFIVGKGWLSRFNFTTAAFRSLCSGICSLSYKNNPNRCRSGKLYLKM